LFITGQDVGYRLKNTDFYKNYLHAQYVQDNIGIYNLKGQNGFDFNFSIKGGDGANNQKWPDEIEVLSPAKVILKYDGVAKFERDAKDGFKMAKKHGHAALFVKDKNYKAVYFAFGFEAISYAGERAKVMKAVVDMLMPSLKERINNLLNFNELLTSVRSDEIKKVLAQREVAKEALFNMIKDDSNALNYLDVNNFGDLINEIREYRGAAVNDDNGDTDDDDLPPIPLKH
jgi:hypothetical protein